jgi:aspartate/methionine/tyrosine aminotransferase
MKNKSDNAVSPEFRASDHTVDPFLAMDVLRKAAELESQGRSIIHLEVGQPGSSAPAPAVKAAMEKLLDGKLGYTESQGIRPLRQAISDHYAAHYDIEVPIERIVITPGSSGAFNLIFLAALNRGDRVILPTPGYPAYRNMVAALGLEVVNIPTTLENNWMPTVAQIEAAHAESPVKAVLIASPNNPTGTMLSTTRLRQLLTFCRRQAIWFISDEIYHGLVYDGEEVCALEFDDNAIIVNSFSKHFCMTGWRVGWTILPEMLVRPVECLAQSFFISTPEVSQYAAVQAFQGLDEMEQVTQGYDANRTYLMRALPELGFTNIAKVSGAFYIYAGIQKFDQDCMAFVDEMLTVAGVAATPGLDFDPDRGHDFVRFSFAGTAADMHDAVTRIGAWLNNR